MFKIVILLNLFINSTVFGGTYLDQGFSDAAKVQGVSEILLRAICFTESSHVVSKYEYEDGGPSNPAFGICQVLLTTARSYISVESSCHRDFRTRNELIESGKLVPLGFKAIPRVHHECKLFGVKTNIMVAAKYLKRQLRRYKNNWKNAIAAYDLGTTRTCPVSGYIKSKSEVVLSCTPGSLANQKYVDRVLRSLSKGN